MRRRRSESERKPRRQSRLERLKNGVTLCRQSGPSEGLPLIAAALQIAPAGDAYDHLREVIRRTLGSWGRPVGPSYYPLKDLNNVSARPNADVSVSRTAAPPSSVSWAIRSAGRGDRGGAGRRPARGLLRPLQRGRPLPRYGFNILPEPGRPHGQARRPGVWGIAPGRLRPLRRRGGSHGGRPSARVPMAGSCRWELATGQAVGPPLTLPSGETVFAAHPTRPRSSLESCCEPRGGMGRGDGRGRRPADAPAPLGVRRARRRRPYHPAAGRE